MDPQSLGWPADEAPIEVRRTHLSEVFLGRTRVLKTKRRVNLGFVDFRTLEARRAACEAEVHLNRRLAPGVYLGLRRLPNGEPAVEMLRLADEDSLLSRLERGTLDAATVAHVGRRIAAFHAEAERGPRITDLGGPAVLRANAFENYDQSTSAIGNLVHPDVFASARRATAQALDRAMPLLEARAAAGLVRDTHGDLRLEHVYIVEGEVLIIDCIEFADRFRYSDIALDAAFLAMDLEVQSRPDLAAAFWTSWEQEAGDDASRPLRPMFTSYRSAVRAKVAGITVADPTTPPERRRSHTERARRHWLLAMSQLRPAQERPLLVGIGGRPGTGKSRLAQELAAEHPFEVIRSDVVREELPAVPAGERYCDAEKDRTYAEVFRRAEAALFAGKRVLVDASFVRAAWRQTLVAVGLRWAVPVRILRCVTSDAVARERLRRRVGDASEADESVYDRVHWEPDASDSERLVDIDRTLAVEDSAREAWAAIAGPADGGGC